MEERKSEMSREELEQVFIKSLTNMFHKIIDEKEQAMILDFLDNLNRIIQIGSMGPYSKDRFTRSDGFGDQVKHILAANLAAAESTETRAQILLDALKDKDRCGLEEKFVTILQESKKE